jgi:RecA-family ATPase
VKAASLKERVAGDESAAVGLAARSGISARALMTKTFPPIQWIVRPILVEGLTVFAGAPKLGKSWAMLGIAVAVAGGGVALGMNRCDQGDVLYLALEDNPRRLQSRLKAMCLVDVPERLTFSTDWPNLDGDCIQEIENWLDAVDSPRLVVIDVYAKIRGSNRSNETQYEADYRFVTALQSLAGLRGISIVLVHHTRKMEADDPFDTVSGTRGITGAADSVLVMKRDAGSQQPVLYGRGRDLPDFEKALQWDVETCTWSITGEAMHLAPSIEGQAIMEVIARQGCGMSAKDVAEKLGKKRDNVQHQIAALVKAGRLQKEGRGLYNLFTPFTSFTQTVNRVNGVNDIYSDKDHPDEPDTNPGW